MDLFTFIVSELFGSSLLAYLGIGLMLYIICVLGRMSHMLILSMMALYIMTFGAAFYGMLFWLPILFFSVVYFFLQLYNLIQRTS